MADKLEGTIEGTIEGAIEGTVEDTVEATGSAKPKNKNKNKNKKKGKGKGKETSTADPIATAASPNANASSKNPPVFYSFGSSSQVPSGETFSFESPIPAPSFTEIPSSEELSHTIEELQQQLRQAKEELKEAERQHGLRAKECFDLSAKVAHESNGRRLAQVFAAEAKALADYIKAQHDNCGEKYESLRKEATENVRKLGLQNSEVQQAAETHRQQIEQQSQRLDEMERQAAEQVSKAEELQIKYDDLQADYEKLQIKSDENEIELLRAKETLRLKDLEVIKHEETISNYEIQITEIKKKVEHRDMTIEQKNGELRAKMLDLNDALRERDILRGEVNGLQDEKANFVTENEKLDKKIEGLQQQISSQEEAVAERDRLESALGVVEANVTALREQIAELEQQNSDLKTGPEGFRAGTKGTGGEPQTKSLASELDELDDLADFEDDRLSTGLSKDGANSEAPKSNEGQEWPSITKHDSKSESAKSGTYKSHNPLSCWLQVYVDLWTLFVFWITQYHPFPFGTTVKKTTVFADCTAPDAVSLEDVNTSVSIQVPTPGFVDGADPLVITPVLNGPEKPKCNLPAFWSNIYALLFHLVFYTLVYFCASNYNGVLQERKIWRAANELTRQYVVELCRNSHHKRDWSTFQGLVGEQRWLDILRFKLNSWADVSRAFPG